MRRKRNDPVYLVMMPIANMIGEPVFGSIVRWCTICRQPCWLSPHGIDMTHDVPTVQLVCTPCSVDAIADHGDATVDIQPVRPHVVPEWIERTFIDSFKDAIDQRRRKKRNGH